MLGTSQNAGLCLRSQQFCAVAIELMLALISSNFLVPSKSAECSELHTPSESEIRVVYLYGMV